MKEKANVIFVIAYLGNVTIYAIIVFKNQKIFFITLLVLNVKNQTPFPSLNLIIILFAFLLFKLFFILLFIFYLFC